MAFLAFSPSFLIWSASDFKMQSQSFLVCSASKDMPKKVIGLNWKFPVIEGETGMSGEEGAGTEGLTWDGSGVAGGVITTFGVNLSI